jgi:outer membrane protein assembly factor BamB
MKSRFAQYLLAVSTSFCVTSAFSDNWPAWRGADGSGITREKNLPLRWSATENVRWKIALPDRGNSSPVVWGTRIFIAQALEKEGRRTLMCLDRANGKVLWQRGVDYAEKEQTHNTNPYCSATPVTDGERVIVWFGSAGIACYDFEGKELWKRDLGKQKHIWGYGGSPILYRDLCILNFGPGERSFLIALDKRTGKTVWQQDVPVREFKTRNDNFAGNDKGEIGSWSTPLVIRAEGRDELIISWPGELRAFAPLTGKELWRCDGLNPLLYTSPIYGEGVLVAMGGYCGSTVAVRPGGNGDVTQTHRLWQTLRSKKNRLACGVIKDGHIYLANMEGFVECIELKTGRSVWEERMPAKGPKSESWSSATLVEDRVYIPNQSGDVVVLRASPKFEVIGVNSVGNEMCNASLAISNGDVFLRTHQHLWCFSANEKKSVARTD